MSVLKDYLISEDTARGRRRLKPIAWVIIIVTILVLVAAVAWGISQITRSFGPAPLPTATPSGGEPTTTPTPTPAYPIDWDMELGRDEQGRLIGIVDDPAVLQALQDDFLEAWHWLWASETPHNLDDLPYYFAPLPDIDRVDPAFESGGEWWYSLETTQEHLRPSTTDIIRFEGGEWNVEVVRFLPEGYAAVVRGQYVGGTCEIDIILDATGEDVGGGTCRNMVYVAGMVYSEEDGRWRVASLREFSPD